MAVKPAFLGKVIGGKLKLNKPEAMVNYIKKFEGKEVRLRIELKSKDRTLPQNNYYWGVVIAILADHLGYQKHELHELMRIMFLSYDFVDKKRNINVQMARSTTSLSTAEFEEYVEKVRTWALTEHEVKIPLPNEVDLEDYNLHLTDEDEEAEVPRAPRTDGAQGRRQVP